MRTATGTLITAITSKERFPVAAVLSDPLRNGSWAMDPGVFIDTWQDTWPSLGEMGVLTGYVESIDLDESLATDLPAGARTGPGGLASAQATIVLTGAVGSMPLAEAFSGFDNPLSTLAPRIGMPVTIALGFTSSIGPETLPQFTGKVRSCSVDPDAGTVTLVALDNRERFRTPVALPVVFADDHGTNILTSKRPGLNAQFLIDAIARRQGYYASPPIRANCILSATLHGSAWPEVGTLIAANTIDYATSTILIKQASFGVHSDGLLGVSAEPLVENVSLTYAVGGGLTLNNGQTIFVEYDHLEFPNQGYDDNVILRLSSTTSALWFVEVIADTSFNNIVVNVTRNGATAAYQIPFAEIDIATGGEHYVGCQITLTATGFVAQARVDNSTGTVTGTVGNPSGSPVMDRATVVAIGDNYIGSGLQVTTEAYSAGMFNHAFVPTAIYDPSLNELTSTPIVDTSDPWLLVQQIADAEQGIVTFVDAILHFYNRDHLTGGAAVATITTDGSISFANLKASASSDEAIDTVNNYITASATPYLLDPASTVIWELSEVMSVPAGSTITIPAEFPGPIYTVTSITHRASQTADGTGGDVTNLVTTWARVTASSIIITVTNPNAFPAYLVGNLAGGTPGDPTLDFIGQCTRPSEFPYTSIRTDAASVALYGTQPLDVADNPFRQSKSAADALTTALLTNLKEPHPEISDLEIVGDPRLQLTDRTRVADPTGLVLDDDFWLTARKTRYSANDGLAQSVSMRQA